MDELRRRVSELRILIENAKSTDERIDYAIELIGIVDQIIQESEKEESMHITDFYNAEVKGQRGRLKEMAEAMDMRPQHVHRLLNGELANPTLDTILRAIDATEGRVRDPYDFLPKSDPRYRKRHKNGQ